MVVHNPNNWHWVDKNCLPWTKEYFNTEVVNLVAEHEETKITLTAVDLVDGDCDVTQRKGKVNCIYDMKLQFSVSGTCADEEFSGTIVVPEFFHDQEDDEYIFEVTSSKSSDVKSIFVPLLKSKLKNFQADLISSHEKDVQHATS